MISYCFGPKEGFDGNIGELVSMLEHTRAITLKDISELSQTDLDFLSDEGSNTIGALLLHIAAIESVFQIVSFERRNPNEAELSEMETALGLGEKARAEIKEKPLEYYLDVLTQIREKTITLLKTKMDSWLYEEHKWDETTPCNNYWIWFHVMEDEINHRGQIRMIKRLLFERKMERSLHTIGEHQKSR